MADHEQTYDGDREKRLLELLRGLAERIRELDASGDLLKRVPELQTLLGLARSELFHYEVRSTYDTPEIAENRRIVEDARTESSLTFDEPDEDEPWRGRPR